MSSFRRFARVPTGPLLAVAFAAAISTGLGGRANAVFVEPQATALDRTARGLGHAGRGAFRGGAPRLLAARRRRAAGATPAAQARAFLAHVGRRSSIRPIRSSTLIPVDDRTRTDVDVVLFRQRFRGIPVFGGRLAVGILQPPTGGPPRSASRRVGCCPRARARRARHDSRDHAGDGGGRGAQRARSARAPVLGETALMLFDPSALGEPIRRSPSWYGA